jgi:hypothetical protein
MVPAVELPPAVPFTDQVTPVLSPVTIAVNGALCPEPTTADCGETVTEMATGVAFCTLPQPATNTTTQSTA